MAQMLTGSELNTEIETLFRKATEEIIIISPYIKLHKRIKGILKTRQADDIALVVVFGKNYYDKTKSISLEDMGFFKKFKTVEIRYEERLHAKFYANEKASMITSMNLYDFSMNNNIEFGVLSRRSGFFKSITNMFSDEISLDDQASYLVSETIDNAELIYHKEAIFEKKLLQKKYVKSKVKVDKTKKFFISSNAPKIPKGIPTGYCIRTGKEIPFDLEKPFTEDAYRSWTRYKNPNYPERYCHKTGKPSNGKTCLSKPVI